MGEAKGFRPRGPRVGCALTPGLRATEVEFFRRLNRVVEPAIRAGWGSPRLAPGGLIVLESIGRASGRTQRTPLAATRVCGHVIVGTIRGSRSQWVRNLAAHPLAHYWLGGRRRAANATVLYEDEPPRASASMPRALRHVVCTLAPYTRAGWAFAVLSPRR